VSNSWSTYEKNPELNSESNQMGSSFVSFVCFCVNSCRDQPMPPNKAPRKSG
jgi:hypothetical protein